MSSATDTDVPMNEGPILSFERVRFGKQSRFNPIRTLRPETLAENLDQFEYGYLRNTALIWDAIERRDDVLKSVAPKRKKAVGRRPWKVMTKDDSAEAKAHKATLDYFYNNLTATNATDRNVRGGVRQLVIQMMDCHSKRYSVHHIVWKPSPQGLTAVMEFVPLWYFENLTGELRFLPQDFAPEGLPLNPGEWLVATGDGLMEACSICYIFKHLPLKDWLLYSQHYGFPGTQGKTDAAPGTPEWRTMVEAVGGFGHNWSCVTGKGDEIVKVDMSADGELPMPKLVERADRAMSTLWRGADLSTMSAKGDSGGGGQGASLQGSESDILEGDDCEMIAETLQELDKWVIFYQHGTAEPLAYITIEKPAQKNTTQDIEVDTFLLNAKFPLPIVDAAERYERRIPADGEALLQAPQQLLQEPSLAAAANARAHAQRIFSPGGLTKLIAGIKQRLTAANAQSWRPMIDRLEEIDAASDDAFFPMIERLHAEIPDLLQPTGADDAAISAWQESLSAALGNGLTSQSPP